MLSVGFSSPVSTQASVTLVDKNDKVELPSFNSLEDASESNLKNPEYLLLGQALIGGIIKAGISENKRGPMVPEGTYSADQAKAYLAEHGGPPEGMNVKTNPDGTYTVTNV